MHARTISVQLQTDPAWIPLVQDIAERSSLVFGLPHEQALRLRMAAEEVIAYLATQTPGADLTLTMSAAPSHVCLDFSFPAQDAALWAMNMTTCGVDCDEDALPIIGLVLAARMSSGFEIQREGQHIHMRLRMSRVYPHVEAPAKSRDVSHGPPQLVADPAPEHIKEACLLARAHYLPAQVPPAFATPGMLVDQIAGGEYSALMTMDRHILTGLVLWAANSASSVSFSGPYIFCQDTGETAQLLMDAMIQAIARTRCAAILSAIATADLPVGSFEALGRVPMIDAAGITHEHTVWFRGLREDEGLPVWTHPDLEAFLRQAYVQLALMREIHPAIRQGEHIPARSVLSTQLRPETSSAVMMPMLDGQDMRRNIRDHVDVLHAEGYNNIFVHLDLAQGWHGALVPDVLAARFTPRLVLPYASRADLVVFQHVES